MFARDIAEREPDKPAVIAAATGEVLTYGELEARANRLAHLIRAEGLVPGDHIAILIENGIDLVVADAAAERTGLYYTNVDAKASAEEAGYIVDNSTAKIVLTSPKRAPVAAELPDRCAGVQRWVMLGEGEPPAGIESEVAALATFATTPVDDERLGVTMLYSSGTTGRPKGILRPLSDLKPGAPLPIWKAAGDLYHMREGNVFLAAGPMHHGGSQVPTGLTLRFGGTVVMMERFDAEQWLRLVDAHGVTHSLMVPTMFSRLLALPEEVRARYSVASLEAIAHSAAPCPVTVKRAMIDWFGPIIYETYGASESNGIATVDSHEWLERPGTVGRAAVGRILILDDDGVECPPRVAGNIWFEGATNFVYYGDDEKTAEGRDAAGTRSTTGDIGYLDEDGYLFLTDRVAFMIVAGGVNIYPQEVENVLADHPDVADVAVLGVPDEDRGEVVKAVVAVKPGVAADDATAQRIIASCEGRLAKYKWPRSVDFVDEVPRNTTGKVDKRLLQRRYWKGHATTLL